MAIEAQNIPSELIHALENHQVIPFIGSGVSLGVRPGLFPTWPQLLLGLSEKLESEQKADDAALVRAYTNKNRLLDAAAAALDGLGLDLFYRHLQQHIDVPPAEDADLSLVDAIWKFNPTLVVTTNYDSVLGWCNPRARHVCNHQTAELAKILRRTASDPPWIWHIHGHIEQLASLILAPVQYERLYGLDSKKKSEYAAALLQLRSVIANRVLLFVGFGLQDAYVMELLRNVLSEFEGALPPSYALIKKGELRQLSLWGEFAIQAVEFSDHGAPLLDLVEFLAGVAIKAVEPTSRKRKRENRDGGKTGKTLPQKTSTPRKRRAGGVIRLPHFHFTGVVPPDRFSGRLEELLEAEAIIRDDQSLLLVGEWQSGKTSFCKKLQHRITRSADNRMLVTYLNLQFCPSLTVETFLEHTLVNIAGDIAREVFGCRFSDIISPKPPSEVRHRLAGDRQFQLLYDLYKLVRTRTHSRAGKSPPPLVQNEFTGILKDLYEIIQSKDWDRCLIIYDEANLLPTELSVELLTTNLDSLSEANISCIYAASPQMAKSFAVLKKSLGHRIELGPFKSIAELTELLNRYYFADSRPDEDLPVSEDALKELWQSSKGVPNLIQVIAGGSFRTAHRQKAKQIDIAHVRAAVEEAQRETEFLDT